MNCTSLFLSSALTALLLLLATPPGMAAPAKPAADPIDRILIVVNDEVVTASEVETRLALVRKRLASQKVPLPPPDVLKRQVMEGMAVERLQLQEARRFGIKIGNEQIERAIQFIAEKNHKTPELVKREGERENGSLRAFHETLRTELILDQLRMLVSQLPERESSEEKGKRSDAFDRISVTDREVEDFIANQAARGGGIEYNFSYILISLPESATNAAITAAREKSEQILAQVRHGADFGQVAVTYSQGPNALDGGNVGWKQTGQLPDIFVDALRKLEPGQASGVLRTPLGFSILRLNARRGGAKAVQVTQIHARHILIKTNELVPPREAKRRIELLRERIQQGADFAEMARSNSEDFGSSANGGDLGWINPGTMVPEFEKAMNTLKAGALSEPVVSPFGVHLIQVLEQRKRDVGQEVEATNARNLIYARKAEERYARWFSQVHDGAYIDYRSDADK